MALSFAESIGIRNKDIYGIFEKSCAKIRDRDNMREVKSRLDGILDALETFFSHYRKKQRPILVQPIWKTQGSTAIPADQRAWENKRVTGKAETVFHPLS